MTESTIVKAAIILYAVVAIIALALLWKNAAASDALKNAGILAAAILPVLIAVLPYVNVQEELNQYNMVLLFDSKEKGLTTGKNRNPYEFLYNHMFVNLSKASPDMLRGSLSDFEKNKGLDIIEKGIVDLMMLRFGSHWDIIWHEDRAPTAIFFSGRKGTVEASKQLSLEQIRELFSHNKLISTPGILTWSALHIPPGSILKTAQPNETRVITIATHYSTVSVTIRNVFAGVAQQGVWGVLAPDPLDMNRYYIVRYRVSLSIKPNRFKKYSPDMESYSRWHQNIKDLLQGYDWEYVDQQIERQVMREAVSTITQNEAGSSKRNH